MSLRRRVLLGCLAVAFVMLAADVVLAGTFRSYLLTRVDEQLVEFAGRVGRAQSDRRPGGPPPGPARAYSEYFLGTADREGNLRANDSPFAEEPAPRADPGEVLANVTARGQRPRPFTADGWRLVAFEQPGDGPALVVGSDLGGAEATYARLLAVLGWATSAVLVTSALVAWWVLRQGIRPLAAMAVTAGAIADGALSERVSHTDDRTEAGRLGRAFNAMLARIEDAFAQRDETEARLRRFAADASHELRTPLTSIRGYADLYRQGALDDPADLDGAMRRVESEAVRMGALVDDLLLLARLDQGRPLEDQPVRLDELVDDAVRDARAVEPDRPITLRVAPVTVQGDEARLRQALGNLLTNARVHTPPGTPVDVSVAVNDGWTVVEVADAGPGLDAATARHVFERFFRADTARTRADGGTGLGLAIVAGVAQAHGGEVGLDSAPGHGARFRLRLPTSQPAHG
jgi:two-component system OmpR family sensor kinase